MRAHVNTRSGVARWFAYQTRNLLKPTEAQFLTVRPVSAFVFKASPVRPHVQPLNAKVALEVER